MVHSVAHLEILVEIVDSLFLDFDRLVSLFLHLLDDFTEVVDLTLDDDQEGA